MISSITINNFINIFIKNDLVPPVPYQRHFSPLCPFYPILPTSSITAFLSTIIAFQLLSFLILISLLLLSFCLILSFSLILLSFSLILLSFSLILSFSIPPASTFTPVPLVLLVSFTTPFFFFLLLSPSI